MTKFIIICIWPKQCTGIPVYFKSSSNLQSNEFQPNFSHSMWLKNTTIGQGEYGKIMILTICLKARTKIVEKTFLKRTSWKPVSNTLFSAFRPNWHPFKFDHFWSIFLIYFFTLLQFSTGLFNDCKYFLELLSW